MSDYGLLFYFSEDFAESDVTALQHAFLELAEKYMWMDLPPQFIDDTQIDESSFEEPIRTVGGFLRLPEPNLADRQTEKACFDEVERIVKALSVFSAQTGCEFELELGGIYAGTIANGKPDKSVTLGLLEEWRNSL